MIRHSMFRLGIASTRHVAKVGDAPVDLEEGRNAGCGLIIGVTTGSFTRQQIEAIPSSGIVDSIANVLAILQDLTIR
jgi:phosphoglycolate phosphatase-like HAD superfamily hydrolase